MKVLLIILGMTVVTYLPRMIPVVLVEKLRISGKTEQFLSLIPYTAMTALIFPGVLSVADPNPLIGLAGAVTAFALSLKKAPMMVVILGATAAVMIAYLLF